MQTDAWFHRLKAAQRDLIRHAGGIERAATITSHSRSNVGRWNNAADVEMMPPAAVYALELDCGMPVFTAAMAALHGRRLSDPEEDAKRAGDVLTRYAETARQAAELMASAALALADGDVSAAEATSIDRAAANMQAALDGLRTSLAAIKAGGGFSIVQGGKG
jgi:hypothetical protein